MGTEVSYPLGTILTRITPQGDGMDTLKVIGAGKSIIVTQVETFGEAFELTPEIARREYQSDGRSGDVNINAPTFLDPGPSPEQVFAEMARQAETKKVEDLSIVDENAPRPTTRRRGPAK